MKATKKVKNYLKRKFKVNSKIKDLWYDYRLIVKKSNKYSYGHIIDASGKAIVMLSDKKIAWANKTERAKALWVELAKVALEKWVKSVAFDRNGFLYHGRIASICEWAREAGLKI